MTSNNVEEELDEFPRQIQQDENSNQESVNTNKSKQEDKINPYDLNAVKCSIDDQVVNCISNSEFSQNHSTSNIRIFLNIIAVSGAVYAYFNQNFLISSFLCLIYIFVSLYNQFISWFIEKTAVYVSNPHRGQVVRASGFYKDSNSSKSSPVYVIELETFPSQSGLFKNYYFKNDSESISRTQKEKGAYFAFKQVSELEIAKIYTKEGHMEKIIISELVDSFLSKVLKNTIKSE